MSTEKIYESVIINDVEVFRTYRGYDNDIEVYTAQAGNKTYSLYHKSNQTQWHCDWTTSYNCQPVTLEANPDDKDAMLKAFVAMLQAQRQTSSH